MPEQDGPAWPSDDEDVPEGDGGKTAELPVRKVTREEPATVWVPRPKPQQPPPPRPLPPQQGPPRVPPPIPAAPHIAPMRIEPTGELRPAEAATGAPESTPQPPEPPRRRKRRGLVIGGLVLLVIIGLGAAAATPYVSNRLGLPWAPNLPKGDSPQPVAVTRTLHGPDASTPAPTNAGLASALNGPASAAALGTLTGSAIDPLTGSTLWDRNAGQAVTPGSTTKLLTVAAALLTLDHGLQLSTKVVAGAQPDTVIIVAGGDPTLSSLRDGQESVYPGAAHLDDLVAQVKKSAGGTVKKVQLDLSVYSGNQTAPGWEPGDAPSTYAAPIVPAMLDGGRNDPTNDHAPRTGNPALALAQKFAERLGATVASPNTVTALEGAKVLGEVLSAPLPELVDNLLKISDNALADAIARQTAIATGAEPSFAGGAQATLNVLSQNGFDVSGVKLSDGSGLSNLNKVSAELLARLLAIAAGEEGKDPRTAKLRPLLEGLPVAGGSGTLADRYADASSSAGKGWVRAKTGTLSGVNTLAGVVLDTDGRLLVFALMSNGSDTNAGRAALDVVAAALRGCGCR